jgi:hypothetical protein
MARSFLLILSFAFLVSCDADMQEEPAVVPTSVSFSARDLDLLGPITLTLGVEDSRTLGDEEPGDCLHPDLFLPEGQESLHVRASSEAGYHWDVEVPVELNACNGIELSLDNVSTVTVGCMAADEETGTLELRVDHKVIGTVERPIPWDDFLWLESLPGSYGLRRALLELESEGKLALFVGDPGTYTMSCDRPGARHDARAEYFWAGQVGYRLVKKTKFTSPP